MDTATGRATRIAPQANLPPFHLQSVEQQQAPDERLSRAGKHFNRLGGLGGADHADNGSENPVTATRIRFFPRLRIQAAITGTLFAARVENCNLAFEADRRAGNERRAGFDAQSVQSETGSEIIGAIDNHIGAFDILLEHLWRKLFSNTFDSYFRIERL